MNRKLVSVIVALVAVFVVFLLIALIGPLINESLKLDNTAVLRFVFVAIGLLIVFGVYFFTRQNKMWEVGTREVVYMAIGAALYAVLSFAFNGTVFVVPSVSQVALRPAICIPMFFGFAFGPVVGLFTGAVGNMFGDALTGFGLSPQWSVGNGLIGMIAGLVWLFEDKKKSLNAVLIVSGVLAALGTLIYFLNQAIPNMLFFDPAQNILGGTRYHSLPMISVTTTKRRLIAISHLPHVRSIYGNRTLQWNIEVAARNTIGSDRVRRSSGFHGSVNWSEAPSHVAGSWSQQPRAL